MKMSGGVSKIKENIKTVNDFKPEKQQAERNFKRVNSFLFLLNLIKKFMIVLIGPICPANYQCTYQETCD